MDTKNLITIDANGLHYKVLNEKINTVLEQNHNVDTIIIDNVCGQRYIGAAIKKNVRFVINGTPGNDLSAFMDGTEIVVNGNAQDAIGNTMNSGTIIVHGNAGDIVGYGMRGGKIYIKGNVGYRVGIHMKAFKENFPVIVVGGETKDFLGEYMAGGLLIVLGLYKDTLPVGDFVGTGMHGGTIFIRKENIDDRLLGKEVKSTTLATNDLELLTKYLSEYCKIFNFNLDEILSKPFIKLYPYSHRPYGRLYAY
ncbi:MAG: hypothetical protein SNJ64_01525 [Endomicrobiia bacterium]